LTPPAVISSKLLTYDRLVHLLPLLQLYARQSLKDGKGSLIDFDLEIIERRLQGELLAGKQKLRLHLRHYQYRGDIRGSGILFKKQLNLERKKNAFSVFQYFGVQRFITIKTFSKLITL